MKKNEILPFAVMYLVLENSIFRELTQRSIWYVISYMCNIRKYKKKMNISEQKHSHRYRDQTGGYQ